MAASVAAYALSPIDLIPDFVPVIGYFDDLLLVPLGIMLAVRLIPGPIMAELRLKAAKLRESQSRTGLVAIIVIWVAAATLAVWLVWPFHT